MHEVGKVLSLYVSNEGTPHSTEEKEIYVDLKGIVNDKHYDKDIDRSILVTSIKSYELARSCQIDIPYGTLGENLLIDFNPYDLAAGARLKVGNAILEINQNCTLCKHLSKVDKQLPRLLKNDRGVFVRVVQEGSIKVDSPIYLLN